MLKITSAAELNEAYKSLKPMLAARMCERNEDGKYDILVCSVAGCKSSNAKAIVDSLKEEIKALKLEDKVRVVETGCFGFCERGPIAKVKPDDSFYVKLDPQKAKLIVNKHIAKGEEALEIVYEDNITKKRIPNYKDIPFYHKQTRVALANCGLIDPESLEEYIAAGGYQALSKALFEMTPELVIEEIKKSGLRGRGGGGFPTGNKWEAVRKSEGDEKFIIMNADEGDPGAFMDRSILEGDPFSVVEAMTIGAYAIGANKGYIYVRAEYPHAIIRLSTAIKQCKKSGLLGQNIMGSGFDFDLELKLGAGAFVCGEETALMRSIEGKRGEPNPKPPYPVQKGLWGKPTCINNVETYANVPQIIRNGAEWYAAMGYGKSRGTKVFSLTGKVNNTGLVEVEMGVTLREIIYDIGGGIKGGKKFKAVQTGGPSGGCITEENLDTPITYENLTEIGSVIGSGGMIVMDEDDCMVSVAKFYLEFTNHESCGKCTPCRIGNKRLYEMLTDIVEGRADMEILDRIELLCHTIKKSSLCGLGQAAPNPVLSTIKYFRDEYIEHIRDKKCRAGVCKFGKA